MSSSLASPNSFCCLVTGGQQPEQKNSQLDLSPKIALQCGSLLRLPILSVCSIAASYLCQATTRKCGGLPQIVWPAYVRPESVCHLLVLRIKEKARLQLGSTYPFDKWHWLKRRHGSWSLFLTIIKKMINIKYRSLSIVRILKMIVRGNDNAQWLASYVFILFLFF